VARQGDGSAGGAAAGDARFNLDTLGSES